MNNKKEGGKEGGDFIIEISAKQLIEEGYFRALRRAPVIASGIRLPIIMTAGMHSDLAITAKEHNPPWGMVPVLGPLQAELVRAIGRKDSIETIQKIEIEGREIWFVIQPFASDDQRPVITMFYPNEY